MWGRVSILAALAVSVAATAHPAEYLAAERAAVLELGSLKAPPRLHPAHDGPAAGGLRPVFFDGLAWKGRPTRVYAWLGLPESKERVPGIVLVHGGGGTAFQEWVERWCERGYAAISIAVEGQTDLPVTGGGRRSWKRHAWAGPSRSGIYADLSDPLRDQWMYHAVAATVLANSLLRSLPEVDGRNIGVMGVSWGGVITSTVMGIDSRFAFAIPTYGSGHLFDAQNHWGAALRDQRRYREVWDPMVRIGRARMPALWLSWPEDRAFPLDCQAESYRAAPGSRMVALIPGLGHSHRAAWETPDSYAFADSVVRSGKPWLAQESLAVRDGRVFAAFASTKPLQGAALLWTADHGFTGRRKWTEAAAKVEKLSGRWVVTADLPDGATAWFVNVVSGGLTASSEYRELR